MTREEKYMMEAIQLSKLGMANNEGGPFGCVIVKGDEIVGRGNNKVTSNNDPTAHAEVVAIRDACKNLSTFQLTGCDVYASCEPCPMCLGAIYWARPRRVIYASTRYQAADAGFDDDFIYREIKLSDIERQIIFQHQSLPDAVAVFEEWKKIGNKKLY